MQNTLQVLHIYNFNGTYVFDDASTGLVREPFVDGIPEIFEYLLNGPVENFTAIFSASPFPGAQAQLKKVEPQFGGTIYQLDGTEMQGWLCPALFKYFAIAPEVIYAQFKNIVLRHG